MPSNISTLNSPRWQSYPAYKPSGVEWLGDIPAHWSVVPLKYAIEARPDAIKTGPFGSQLLSSEMLDGEIKVYNQRNVIDGDCYSGDNYISRDKYDQLRSFAVLPGDILITTRGTIGRCTVVPPDAETGILHPCLMRIQPNTKRILHQYLVHLIEDSPVVKNQLLLKSNATTIEVIYSGTMRQVLIIVPPLDEQRAINEFLDRETVRLDTLIAKKQRLIELLQEKRTALISQAVTKGLDPNVAMKDSGVEWLGEIPAHWEVRRLKSLISFVTSGSRGWAAHYSDAGALFLRIGNLSRESIELDMQDIQRVDPPSGAEGRRTRVQPDDVLISVTANIGSVGVVPRDIEEAYVNQHIALTRPRSGIVSSRWVAYFLASISGQWQFQQLQYGGTKVGLGLDDVQNLQVLLPPYNEQLAMVALIDKATERINCLIARINVAIDRLREYRTALISAAVTGKIDVRPSP